MPIIRKYHRKIRLRSGYVDVYDVAEAFKVENPALQHALKKILAAGERGHKDRLQDLKEVIASVERAIQMVEVDQEYESSDLANIRQIEVDEERLRSTIDASIWAEEFAKVCDVVDQGFMTGWFANAIETARSFEERKQGQDLCPSCGNLAHFGDCTVR